MRLLEDVMERELQELNDQGVQIRHIGGWKTCDHP